MPRKKTGDDETPRRRRGAASAAAEPERGLLVRALLYSPKDMLAGLIAFAAASALITNALFLQSGPHPAPMFGSAVAPSTSLLMPNPLPRPRPAEADALALPEPKRSDPGLFDPKPVEPPPEPKPVEQRTVAPRPAEPRASDSHASDPMANLVKSTTSTPSPSPSPSNALRPPASIPTTGSIGGAKRVAAVQRVLTEYGYAQLKPTGILGADTKAAIEHFERERRLPVDGQVSDRLVRELYAATGHSVE